MLQVCVVHAAADGPLAGTVADYLEINCPVQCDRGPVIGADLPILDAVGRALSADFVIVVVSSHSAPARLARERWEPLFVDAAREHATHLAFVDAGDSAFPRLLLRDAFHPDSCKRGLRRWVLERLPGPPRATLPLLPDAAIGDADFESLMRAAGDRPFTHHCAAGAARGFAQRAEPDFEGVFRVDARGATLAGVAGDLGAQLGLKLARDTATNLDAIRTLCARHRCLILLEGLDPDFAAAFEGFGRASVLIAHMPALPPASLDEARDTLRRIARHEEGIGAGAIRRSLDALLARSEQWKAACDFARAAIARYVSRDRLAEALEIAEPMLEHAVNRMDRSALTAFARERAWILEAWGQTVVPSVFALTAETAQQLSLW